MSNLRLEVGQSTDVCRRRTVNEDNLGLLVPPETAVREQIGALFVVAYGMGGHAKGEVASALAVSAVLQSYLHNDTPALEERLSTALRQANAAIWNEASRQTDHAGMGTTVVCAAVIGSEMLVSNAGDSRAYLI